MPFLCQKHRVLISSFQFDDLVIIQFYLYLFWELSIPGLPLADLPENTRAPRKQFITLS